jgi:uncharacterized coiled-coil protein SlyX
MDERRLDERLSGLETRLARLEAVLGRIDAGLEGARVEVDTIKDSIQQWVTEYVSLRLQQLVPETCEHAPDSAVLDGPVLPGTRVRCTDEVLHRLGRIPIPFVRQMVSQRVADTARAQNVAMVDVTFFERAATF